MSAFHVAGAGNGPLHVAFVSAWIQGIQLFLIQKVCPFRRPDHPILQEIIDMFLLMLILRFGYLGFSVTHGKKQKVFLCQETDFPARSVHYPIRKLLPAS